MTPLRAAARIWPNEIINGRITAMAGYIIVQVNVEDPEAYKTYVPQVPPTL